MSLDARLNKLAPALSARERAILVLGTLKNRGPEDPNWRRTMPPEQYGEFNRLIDLMNGVNISLDTFTMLLKLLVEKLELRESWLFTLHLWDEHVEEIRRAVRISVREPITQSEHRALVERARQQWVPVGDLAEVLAEAYDGWTEADLEALEGWDEPVVSDAAWERVRAEQEQELRRLAAEGVLPAKGGGSRLRLRQGAFDDWRGCDTGVVPELLPAYRLQPDQEARAVQRERLAQQALHHAFDWSGLDRNGKPSEQAAGQRRLIEMVGSTVVRGFIDCWVQLRAGEIVLEEVATEFEGVDPLHAQGRERLMGCRESLLELQRDLGVLGLEVPTPEPDDEVLGMLRQVVRRGRTH